MGRGGTVQSCELVPLTIVSGSEWSWWLRRRSSCGEEQESVQSCERVPLTIAVSGSGWSWWLRRRSMCGEGVNNSPIST